MATQDKKLEIQKKIFSFRELNTDGWDSYQAKQISESALLMALAMFGKLCQIEAINWEVIPTVKGGVLFEGRLRDLEFYFEISPAIGEAK